jgi:hypothetical protein
VSAPAIVIRLELEQPTRLHHDCMTDGEYARLLDWLRTHPAQAALVARAIELVDQERAA